MSNMGALVRSDLRSIWQSLMITERTLSGLVHLEKIEEMDRELSKVMEDFDRAVNVEALHQAKETSKHSLFSIWR